MYVHPVHFYFVDVICSLPRPKMIQTDLSRLINSDEIQKVVRPIRFVQRLNWLIRALFTCFCDVCRSKDKRFSQKKNPLKNLNVMLRLNPYAKTFRRQQLLLQMRRKKEKAEKANKKGSYDVKTETETK